MTGAVERKNALSSIMALLSGSLTAKLIGLVAVSIYARVLEKSELAVIPIFYMLTAFTVIPFSFGIYPTLVRNLPKLIRENNNESVALIKAASKVLITGGGIVSCAIFVFSSSISSTLLASADFSNTIKIMAVGCFLFVIDSILDRVLWAAGRFQKTAKIQVYTAVIKPVFTLSLYYFFGVVGIVIGLVTAQLVSTLLSFQYAKDLLSCKTKLTYSTKELISKSLPFYLESYLMYFRKEGDNWFVNLLLGPSGLAIYYIAKTLYAAANSAFYAVDRVLTKQIAELAGATRLQSTVKEIFENIAQTAIPLVSVAILGLPLAINTIAGNSYSASIEPAALLLIALSISVLRVPVERTVFVEANPLFRLYITVWETCFLLVSLFLLGKSLGVEGVAISRVIAQLSGAILGWILFRKILKMHVPISTLFLVVFISSICLLFTNLTMEMLSSIQESTVLKSAVSVICFVVFYSLLSFLFNKKSRFLLKKIISRSV